MIPGFLAIIRPADPAGAAWITRLVGVAARDLGLAPIFQNDRLQVLANAAAAVTMIGEGGGVVLGTLFRRNGGTGRHDVQDGPLDKSVGGSAGDDLLCRWWGGYVAFIIDGDRSAIHVLRDPSGGTPCYHCEAQGAHVYFSDIDIARALGLIAPRLDPLFVAHYLAYSDLRTARTGLVGVEEVLAGTRQSHDAGGAVASRRRWTPWAFAAADQQIQDRGQAVERVRAETQRCVSAWASRSRYLRLELSGGLDSSIVAACLRDQGAAVACATLVTPDPGADERRYARCVSQSIGAPLEEIMLDPTAGDVRDAPRILSPRPGMGIFQQVLDSAFTDRASGVDAFFTGSGGDNVFCYLNTAAPAADVLRTNGPGPLFLRTVGDLAALHGCTMWRAGELAVRKALRRPGSWRLDPLFLSKAAIPAGPEHHPWLDTPRGALPGKREHIAALMRIQNAPDGKARHALAPVRYPLLSQPLVELCLTVPSWMWITGGRNRSLARDAFAGRLPTPVLERTTKGDFTGFMGAIYDRQRSAVADLLLGGWLARQGLLDLPAVEAYLAATDPSKDVNFYRLLELAGVEIWARSWLELTA